MTVKIGFTVKEIEALMDCVTLAKGEFASREKQKMCEGVMERLSRGEKALREAERGKG